MNASWPQTKTIWSICIKIKPLGYQGEAVDPQFWRKLAESGQLDKKGASDIISSFIEKKSGVFQRLVKNHDPGWDHDTAVFMKARRWIPKQKYTPPDDGPVEIKEAPKKEAPKLEAPKKEPDPKLFIVGVRVRYRAGAYNDKLKGKTGTIRAIMDASMEQTGVEYDEDIGGHNLAGALGQDSVRGWWCRWKDLDLLVEEAKDPEGPWDAPTEEDEETKQEPPPEEDEFTKKLRELEEAHNKAKQEAARKRKMEKFNPASIEYVKPEIFDDVCAMIKGGVQICLVGPSGCGKSLLINEVAKVLQREMYMESFAGGKRYSQVFGSTHLIDGKSEWVPAKFLTELQRDNMIIFMDEVMSADADVLIGANPILDRKTRTFHSPVGPIKVNPTCTICAASNVTGREYSMNYKGTQQQDASVLNRFVHIHMGYDKTVEKTILRSSPLDKADQDELFKLLEALRTSVSSNNISYDPSTRKLVQAIELMALGLPRAKAFEYAFLTPLSVVERRKIGM